MKEIPLTKGKVALVDNEDYEKLSKYHWGAVKDGKTYYAVRYFSEHHNLRMHIAIMGKKEGMQIDHINGNGLDNRKENLRFVTCRQNLQNKHTPKTSKFPGVWWNKQNQKWQAGINIEGKNVHLGYYVNEIDASEAYKNACDHIGCSIEEIMKGTSKKENGSVRRKMIKKRTPGKPVGTRSIPTLHAEILRVLKEDKERNGDGMTASGISKALATPDPTVRLYLSDLVEQKKVSFRRIAGMTLYRLRATKQKP